MADSNQDNARVVAPPPLLYLGPLLLGLFLQRLYCLPVLPLWPRRLLGWPLLFAGIALNTWMVLTMRRARTSIDPRKPSAKLVTWGPFRFSRNPSYTSFTLVYAGIAVLRNAVWPFLLLPGVILAMQRGVIEREERYLERRFGEEYRRFRRHVRRWL